MEGNSIRYEVRCWKCAAPFEAMDTAWCACISVARTLVCPNCLGCFCAAPNRFKMEFWAGAPERLWERRLDIHKRRVHPEENPTPENVKRPLVLVVDPSTNAQQMAYRAALALGYGAIFATDGLEGLELAKRYHPDLVLTETLMPKLDGHSLCLALENEYTTSTIPIVILTSLYQSAHHKHEALKRFHVSDYLTKPVTIDVLERILAHRIGKDVRRNSTSS